MPTTEAVLAAIDKVTAATCGHCQAVLDDNAPSTWWCSPDCQRDWTAHHHGAPQLHTWMEDHSGLHDAMTWTPEAPPQPDPPAATEPIQLESHWHDIGYVTPDDAIFGVIPAATAAAEAVAADDLHTCLNRYPNTLSVQMHVGPAEAFALVFPTHEEAHRAR